ncbi:MAG: ASCH domain-containing protein [Hadesarchaea archaeon]|nr:ASCH domain-containing protein [Hadesarchaea archaeon]
MNVLLSIEPRFAEAILSGTKKWEFRSKKFRIRPKKVYIYCTKPVQRVVGFFEAGKIISGPPSEIWEICGAESGISYDEFICRFKHEKIYAIEILKVRKFVSPIELNKLGISTPPQSFTYFDTERKI